jgi:tRNA G10  N-methylase Trm11
MYVWHKFWSRKTWNVVAEHIKTYCPEGGIVFDPFAGSGVTALETLKSGRRAIACDLLPIATELIRLTIQPADLDDLKAAFQSVEKRVREKIEGLYLTNCRRCRREFPFTCAIWELEGLVEIRYEKCPQCGDRRERECPPERADLLLLRTIQARNIKEWYPRSRLYYPDGRPFNKKERYESLDELFTKRNLQALAWLMSAIEKEPDTNLRDFLRIAFTSMVHLCSRLAAAGRPGYRPFSGVGWNQQSYWFTPTYLESNVWQKFENAVTGRQGLLGAKEESNGYFAKKRIVKNLSTILKGTGDVYIHTGDCLELMEKMPEEWVDYIFTDPPYGSSIQFGELAYLWVSWLKKDEGYLDSLLRNEIVENRNQRKEFETYEALLRRAFDGMQKVLKPGAFLTVTFHNPTFRIRNATMRAGYYSGFEFEHIHLQELARASAKSLLQPYGSAHGDFYLRFSKPRKRTGRVKLERDVQKFERVVVDAVISVLADRGEPTPKYIVDNYVDPILMKNGLFPSIEIDGKRLDVDEVLKAHEGTEFVRVPVEIGEQKGGMWWFKNPGQIRHLEKIPISERVEQTIVRLLQERGRVSFTEALDKVFVEFPNSLTTDTTSVKEALKLYAVERGQGTHAVFVLNPAFHRPESAHNQMVGTLAEIGSARGYKVWIGQPEQSQLYPSKKRPLAEWATASLRRVKNILNLGNVERIDCLWIRENRIECSFDVEATTPLSEAINRGSGIADPVERYIVLPEERHQVLNNRLKNPHFRDGFEKYGWKTLYFSALKASFSSLKRGRITLQEMANTSSHNPRIHRKKVYGYGGSGGVPPLFRERSDTGE